MPLKIEKNIIKNYVFNYLKEIEISQIESEHCRKILKKIEEREEEYKLIIKCLIMKNIEIYTDKLTYIFNKNFYNTFISPYGLNRRNDWSNVGSFWNSSFFSSKEKAYYLFIDIGNFKKINDEFSYKIGDAFLKLLGIFLIKEDIGFNIRNGGDEFVIISNNKQKVEELIKKFHSLLFIKNINLNLLRMDLVQKKEEKDYSSIKDNNKDNNIVYLGIGMFEIDLNKIRKYIETKNGKAYKSYITDIENIATSNMKKFKNDIKNYIKITAYRS